MTTRHSILLVSALLALLSCQNINVGADNRYGYSRGAAVVTVPLETTDAAGVKSVPVPVWSVHDGTTLVVLLRGVKENVRLIGIEAPELDKAPWGGQSRDALKGLVEGRSVRLVTDARKRDHNGQMLAYVYAGDLFVNLELVRQGQAVIATVPPNVAHVEEYQRAQAEARDSGRGVWSREQPLDVMPDCFRKQKMRVEC